MQNTIDIYVGFSFFANISHFFCYFLQVAILLFGSEIFLAKGKGRDPNSGFFRWNRYLAGNCWKSAKQMRKMKIPHRCQFSLALKNAKQASIPTKCRVEKWVWTNNFWFSLSAWLPVGSLNHETVTPGATAAVSGVPNRLVSWLDITLTLFLGLRSH